MYQSMADQMLASSQVQQPVATQGGFSAQPVVDPFNPAGPPQQQQPRANAHFGATVAPAQQQMPVAQQNPGNFAQPTTQQQQPAPIPGVDDWSFMAENYTAPAATPTPGTPPVTPAVPSIPTTPAAPTDWLKQVPMHDVVNSWQQNIQQQFDPKSISGAFEQVIKENPDALGYGAQFTTEDMAAIQGGDFTAVSRELRRGSAHSVQEAVQQTVGMLTAKLGPMLNNLLHNYNQSNNQQAMIKQVSNDPAQPNDPAAMAVNQQVVTSYLRNVNPQATKEQLQKVVASYWASMAQRHAPQQVGETQIDWNTN